MNTKDLTLLSVGAAIVIFAYLMKKNGIEGFQGMPPTAPPEMPPVVVAPGASPSGPPQMPVAPQAMPLGPAQQPTMGAPMGGVPQPQATGMKPNQQQLMEVAAKVQRIASDQSSVAAQLQQMTQSFVKEGFQSYQNPYSAASPGDTQAMEFRLDKKAMVDSVVRY